MQRIIAYIYRYKGDKDEILTKCGNTGFCRVEVSCDKCGVTICFKDICRQSGEGNIYGLVSEKGRCDTSSCYRIKEHMGAAKIVSGQMNTKVEAGGTDGILIECGANIYIAMWRETVDTVCLVREREEKVDAEQEVLNQLKEVEVQKETMLQEQEIIFEEDKEMIEENVDIYEKNIEMSIDIPQENTEMPRENIEIAKEHRNLHKENEELLKKHKTTESLNDKMLERAFNRMCKVRMVIEDRQYQVVKMKPQEMIMLPRSYWRLANNCFLMEGYYTHKHILFFKCKEGYAIGVPGRGVSNESVFANRFGFDERVTGYEYGKSSNKRTYWLMYLK